MHTCYRLCAAASMLSVVFRKRAVIVVDKNKAASWMLRKLLIAQGKAPPSLKPHIICY
jgi:hypothetical protein